MARNEKKRQQIHIRDLISRYEETRVVNIEDTGPPSWIGSALDWLGGRPFKHAIGFLTLIVLGLVLPKVGNPWGTVTVALAIVVFSTLVILLERSDG